RRNRAAEQKPVLLGKDDDFDLVSLSARHRTHQLDAPRMDSLPGWLMADWNVRDEWWRKEDYRTAPWAVRRLEAALLRAEQRWRGGGVLERDREEAIRRELVEGRRRCAEWVDQSRVPKAPVPESVALARPRGRDGDPEILKHLEGVLQQIESATANAKPEERDKVLKQGLGKAAPALADKYKDRPAHLRRP